MSLAIILLVVVIVVLLISALLMFLMFRMPGRSRNKFMIESVDRNTGTKKLLPLNRRKGHQQFGGGSEVYTSGLMSRPVSVEPGSKEIDYPNMTVLYDKSFIDHFESEGWRNYYKVLLQLSRLKSELSESRTELLQHKTQNKDMVRSDVKEVISYVERIKPVTVKSGMGMRR